MARPPRLSLPSYPHHVIQRGNNRQPIFLDPKDYGVFLEQLSLARRAMPTGWRPPSLTRSGSLFDERRGRGEWCETTPTKKKLGAKSGSA